MKKATKDKRRKKRDLKKWKRRRWVARNLKRKRITLGLKIKKELGAGKIGTETGGMSLSPGENRNKNMSKIEVA